jgi:hypothetical protein
VKTHKEADDMPTGNIALDTEDLEEKTWPLNEKAKQRGSVVPLPQVILKIVPSRNTSTAPGWTCSG